MRKLICIITILTMLLSFSAGCTTDAETDTNMEEGTVLTWLTNSTPPNVKYFNKILQEKGFDFTVEFKYVGSSTSTKKEYVNEIQDFMDDKGKADIIHTGSSYNNTYCNTYIEFASRGIALPLDSYIDAENDGFLENIYEQRFLESYRINNRLYGIPSLHGIKQAYLKIDKSYLDKYNINPDTIEMSLDGLEQLFNTIIPNEDGSLRGIEFLNFESFFQSYNEVCNIPFIVINDELKAESLYGRDETYALYNKLNEWIQNGYKQNYDEFLENMDNSDSKTKTLTCFYSAGSVEALGSPRARLEYETVDKLWAIASSTGVPGGANVIASWSEYPDESFELLKALITDPELANALTYGERGVNYELLDGYVCDADTKDYNRVSFTSILGMDNTYPLYYEPLNKKEAYYNAWEQAATSKIYGFIFDDSKVADELQECYDVYYKWQTESETICAETINLDEINSMLRDAGIDSVLEEINRQLAEWDVGK